MPLRNKPPCFLCVSALTALSSFTLPSVAAAKLGGVGEAKLMCSWWELQRPSGTQDGILAPLVMNATESPVTRALGDKMTAVRPCELGRVLEALLLPTWPSSSWPSWLACSAWDSSACCSTEPLRGPCSVSETLQRVKQNLFCVGRRENGWPLMISWEGMTEMWVRNKSEDALEWMWVDGGSWIQRTAPKKLH